MRYPIHMLAIGAAFAATPAAAQLGIGLGGQGGLNVGAGANIGGGVDVGRTLDGATAPVDRTVNTLDQTLNGTLQSDLRLATAADLTVGAEVRDSRGRRIGLLQSVHGNTAVVVSGGKALHVPLASLYRGGKGLVTKLSRAQLEAAASANASAHAGGGANIRN